MGTFAIETERLILRPLERTDVDAFVAYRNEPAVARYQAWDVPFAAADGAALVAGQASTTLGTIDAWLQIGIVERTTGTLLGDCAVRVRSSPPRTAEIGVTLAGASQGRNVAGEALTALLDHLFARLTLHRAYAEIDERNTAARRLIERVGLRQEAELIEAFWYGEEWCTTCVYGVLAREWRAATAP